MVDDGVVIIDVHTHVGEYLVHISEKFAARGARRLARGAARREPRRPLPRRARGRRSRGRPRLQRTCGRVRRPERLRRRVRRARPRPARRLRLRRPVRPGGNRRARADAGRPRPRRLQARPDLPERRPARAASSSRVCEALERLGLPMLIHQGTTFARAGSLLQARPILLDEIALRYPKLKIVIAHIGHPWFDEAIAVVRRHPHVYADVSALVSPPLAALPGARRSAIEYRVEHKLLFGTDFPFFTARQTIDGLRSVTGDAFGPRHAGRPRAGRGGHHPPAHPRAPGDRPARLGRSVRNSGVRLVPARL